MSYTPQPIPEVLRPPYCHCGKALPDEVRSATHPVQCPECKELAFVLPDPLPPLTTGPTARHILAARWALKCRDDTRTAQKALAAAKDAEQAAELALGRAERRLLVSLGVKDAPPIPMSAGDRRTRT